MIFHIVAAAAAGVLLPLQALINARLGALIGGPLWASFVSFGVGFLSLGVLLALLRTGLPTTTQLASLPLWTLAGGLLGAFFVATSTVIVPKLGAAAMVAIIIAGQLAASVLLDHHGVLQQANPVTWTRLLGVALLLAGAYLILRPGV